MAVAFRLLGEVEADIDGQPVGLGHARQRCVLAVLLAANQPVSADQLLDRVWGEHPPQRARDTVYSYLSRLRQLLAATDQVEIVRRSGGYVLAVDPMMVDLHRFRALVARARAAEDPGDAKTRYDEALACWRGEAFAGLETPWLTGLRHALDRERFAAELDRNDLALAGGQHAELLAELVPRHAAYPLDERLAGQLLVALYRCGRQAEALQRYEQLRRRLADELGADPGPELQRLHRQILTADPSVARPTESAAPAVPRQLPAPPAAFTGRARELAELSSAMTAGGPAAGVVTCCIGGPGGIGKSWLALRWAYQNLSRFPDGQLYVNLRGFEPGAEPVPPEVAVTGFLAALGVPAAAVPADLSAQAALFRSRTARTRMLVVLDNARDTSQVLPLLPGGPDNAVLVTSRRRLAGLVTTHGAQPLALDTLDDAGAHDLLTHQLGAERVEQEPGPVAELVDHCAGLPLALGVVAARATSQPDLPLAALAKELADAATRLDALDAGELSVNLRAVLACSYRALTGDAARAFTLLGLAPGGQVGLPAAASLTALPVPRARALLRELVDAHLVQQPAAGRFRLHDLVRLYAGELADGAPGRAALHRVLDHYLRTADAADRAVVPGREPLALPAAPSGVRPEAFPDRAAALAWLAAEHRVLVAAVDHAAAAGFDRYAYELASTQGTHLSRHGHWHDQAATQRTAASAAIRLADPRAEANARRGLGLALIWHRQFREAGTELERARELFDALDDPLGQAHVRCSLARLFAVQDHYREALRYGEQALALYRAAGHRAGEATALNEVGWRHTQLGDHQPALAYCRRAIILFRHIGDRHGEAFPWHSLGHARHHLGQHRLAVRCYHRALQLLGEFHDRYAQAEVYTSLGEVHLAAGDRPAARDGWRRAVRLFQELGHPKAGTVQAKLDELPQPG